MKKIFAILLAVTMLLTCSGCSKVTEQPANETPVHGEVTLKEMIDSYHGVDPDAMQSDIELLKNIIRKLYR